MAFNISQLANQLERFAENLDIPSCRDHCYENLQKLSEKHESCFECIKDPKLSDDPQHLNLSIKARFDNRFPKRKTDDYPNTYCERLPIVIREEYPSLIDDLLREGVGILFNLGEKLRDCLDEFRKALKSWNRPQHAHKCLNQVQDAIMRLVDCMRKLSETAGEEYLVVFWRVGFLPDLMNTCELVYEVVTNSEWALYFATTLNSMMDVLNGIPTSGERVCTLKGNYRLLVPDVFKTERAPEVDTESRRGYRSILRYIKRPESQTYNIDVSFQMSNGGWGNAPPVSQTEFSYTPTSVAPSSDYHSSEFSDTGGGFNLTQMSFSSATTHVCELFWLLVSSSPLRYTTSFDVNTTIYQVSVLN